MKSQRNIIFNLQPQINKLVSDNVLILELQCKKMLSLGYFKKALRLLIKKIDSQQLSDKEQIHFRNLKLHTINKLLEKFCKDVDPKQEAVY